MSSEVLAQVINRMSKDPAFRQAVQADPSKTLAGYDLDEEEIRGLTNPAVDPDVGVDERITKSRSFTRD